MLKGHALSWSDPAGNAEATALFERAIALDPDYGVAHALLAAMRYGQWRDDMGASDAALREAQALAQRAVELDPNESTCFSMLGAVHLMARDFDLALRCLQRAVALNPGNQWNRADLGYVLGYLGEAEASLAALAHAREIDPYFEPPWYWRCVGMVHLLQHRHAEALVQLERVPRPRNFRVIAMMAACHAQLGDPGAAGACVAGCQVAKPDFTVTGFMAKEPLRRAEDAAHLASSLRLAGFPP